MANQKMANAFFGFLQCHGEHLESQPNGWEGRDVGRYRIRYTMDVCGTATIIGQQIQDERMLMTIRKYNPAKITVPYGESTEVEVKVGCCGVTNKILCCYCYCAQNCVNMGMDECIYYACDGEKTIQEYTKSQTTSGCCLTFGRRFGSLAMNTFALFFLVFPIIEPLGDLGTM